MGAGVSGICLAVRLRRAGFDDITLFEKGGDYGGTWYHNTYPGLVCDVPSRYYQFTFAMNPEWSSLYSPGTEIQRYLAHTARAHGLAPHTRFHTEVVGAEFADGRWRVGTFDGRIEEFDFLACATGFLHHPRIPDIPGLGGFRGPVFHSARWDHSVSLRGRRLGVIGTGSTGTQLVRALAGTVPRVVLFQRTAQWILPTVNRRYSPLAKAAHRRWPALGSAAYALNRMIFELFSRGLVSPGPVRELITRVCERNLRGVRDTELRRRLTPHYPPMCKRLVVSDGFYRAVQRDDVELVTAGIDRVVPEGVVTTDGALHEIDILVLATGFDAHAYMRPIAITGTDGRTLDRAWAAGPRAFEATMMPDFPNLFMLIGPHSPIANHPLTAVAEAQSRRVVSWIRRWCAEEFDTVEPTEAATRRFNQELRAASPGTVWAAGCSSWYLGKDGYPELWPRRPSEFEAMMARPPDPADYHLGRRIAGTRANG
ncbi:NAD(P)/FAD-dependent oxidoreductase [Nocardia transvalensis]|uniref:flavin-containing monooxygenase n=1 Tax=Nocardia transvalensis TaxID=37333 RepID=UPI002B4B8634|nr:NAD(P)/FAD-dependent oxidoreductase [Nocardia transvalensis]